MTGLYSGLWSKYDDMVLDCYGEEQPVPLESEVLIASSGKTPDGRKARVLVVFARDGQLWEIYSPSRSPWEQCPTPLATDLPTLKAYADELLVYDLIGKQNLLNLVWP